MSWIPFALLAPALMALVHFGDKYIIEKEIPDYRVALIYLAIVNLGASILLWLVTGFALLPINDALLLMLGGALTIWANIFYFRAIALEEMSKLIVLVQMAPVFTLILSFLFLSDSISPSQLIGFVLIFISAIGITAVGLPASKSSRLRVQMTPAFWLMTGATVIWAVSFVISDVVVDQLVVDMHSLAVSITYASFGYFLGGGVIYLISRETRQQFNQHIQNVRTVAVGAVIAIEVTFVVRNFALFLAFSLGPVALVTVIGSTNVFFGILYGWILTLIAPAIFKEDIRRASLVRKLAWAIVMFVGVTFISLPI